MRDELETRYRRQLERRLNEVGSMVRGNQQFQADRIADLVEQIDELRREVATAVERLDRMAAYLTKQKNGAGASQSSNQDGP